MKSLNRIFSTVTYSSIQSFSTTKTLRKENLRDAKKFKLSSQNWLFRQINDKYVKQAKLEHYRCRSAFKLLEIDKKYRILHPGQTVVDLGCAPGSWTQVAVKATNANTPGSKSLVVGIDLSTIHPVEGATLLSRLDFTTPQAQERVKQELSERKVNVVLSDMSPAASGIKFLDHAKIVTLCYAALQFAKKTSEYGATLVMKLFDGGDTKTLAADAKKVYETVSFVRPEASRKQSTELYLVCLKFKGEQQNAVEPEQISEKDSVDRLQKDKEIGIRTVL